MRWAPDVFRPLERFEASLAALYGAFAERFGEDADAARLFSGLARCSRTRKSQLEFLHKLARQLDKGLPEADVDVVRITREADAVERVRGLIDHVGLEAAVVQSLQLECGAAKAIARDRIAPVHPDLAQMLRGFGTPRDAGNPKLLVDFAAARGIALPPPVAAAAQAAIAAGATAIAAADMLAAESRRKTEEILAKQAAEVAELEAAVKAGKNAIDYRIAKQTQR